MSVDITIQETVNEVDITVNQNVITVNVTRTTGSGGVTSVNGDTGDVVLTTDNVAEGSTNLYFTAARVRATVLTGISFVSGIAITATDTILSAFGKLQKQISSLGAVAFSNDYNDLDNKPTIPTPQNLAQVLAIDNKTNDIPIVSNNGMAAVDVNDDYLLLGYDGGGGSSNISFEDIQTTIVGLIATNIYAGTQIQVNAGGYIGISAPAVDIDTPILKYNTEEVATQDWVTSQGYGTGTVTSVTGDLVDNTDPSNPIVNTPSLDDCAVASGNQMTESVTISAGTDAVGLFPTSLNVLDIATGEGIDITKNGILIQTAGSAGGNASIKSDNITAGNAYSAQLPNKAGGSDEIIAMQSDLDFTRRLITKGTGSVTGTVSETILTTLTIPANTLDSSCFIWTTMDFFKTNAGAVTARLYVNNANTLTGATLLGYSTLGSNRNVSFNRKFLVTGTSLDLLTANTAAAQVSNEFIEALFGASTVLTINPSADIFLIYTTQNDATGTVATNKMATVQKMKL